MSAYLVLWLRRLFVLLALLLPTAASAHVGNKDVFVELNPGPYRLFVTVRPPMVIPGVATVEVRSSGPQITSLKITPVPMVGEASKHPPTPDLMNRSGADPAFFTGSLWLMSAGSWKVQFFVDGAAGAANGSVPVPAMPLQVTGMDKPLGILLGVLGLLLAVGIAGIVAAATRESRLQPGEVPDPPRRRRALVTGAVALVLVAGAVWAGGQWWNVEAADYASYVYRPLNLQANLSGGVLDLKLSSFVASNSRRNRLNSDLLEDHGHLMHLYAIREPGMDAVYHLHPSPVAPGEMKMALPAMPAGRYCLFGDIVHRNGLPETLVAALTVPEGFKGGALSSEDASAMPTPLGTTPPGTSYRMPDGYSMVWDRPAMLLANQSALFRFTLLDVQGKPANDAVTYLGMAGHAAFVKTDFSAFAHTHPEGSAPMQSVMVANGDGTTGMNGPGMSMNTSSISVPPVVEFPYGFPSAGRYRIFVQMKHGDTVETGVFDADVR